MSDIKINELPSTSNYSQNDMMVIDDGNSTKSYEMIRAMNYNNHLNKPQINGETLSGNKTLADLGYGIRIVDGKLCMRRNNNGN